MALVLRSTIFSRYAQYIVGIHYEQGMIVDSDMEKAKAYYLLSSQQEFPDSQTALGIALLQAGDHAQGIKWLEISAQKVYLISSARLCAWSRHLTNLLYQCQ